MSGRYARERDYFDAKAKRRSLGVGIPTDQLLPALRLEAGVSPGSAQDYAIRLLEHCDGLKLLDIGAGEGWASLHFASQGASVTATDVSEASLQVLQARARALGLQSHILPTLVEDEILPFENESFDAVFSNAVLHHLDLDVALVEIHRVLKGNGVAIFMEPLAHHPLVRAYRFFTPGRRTADERPLRWTDLPLIAKHFSATEVRCFELIALPTLALRRTPLGQRLKFLHKLDAWMFSAAPWTKHYSRAVVIRSEK